MSTLELPMWRIIMQIFTFQVQLRFIVCYSSSVQGLGDQRTKNKQAASTNPKIDPCIIDLNQVDLIRHESQLYSYVRCTWVKHSHDEVRYTLP
jgi:hypothetical protein